MLMFLLGSGSTAVLALLLVWAWSKEGPTIEADLLADEVALKQYLSKLHAELSAKYLATSSKLVTEANAAAVVSLRVTASGLTQVLKAIQAELGKLS